MLHVSGTEIINLYYLIISYVMNKSRVICKKKYS